MNIEQARKLSLPVILSKLGYEAVKTAKEGRELWYNSPIRNERTASFHTSIGRAGFWIWKDFGDIGGDIVDFAARYWSTDKKGALANLERLIGSNQQTLFSNATDLKRPPAATTPPADTETLVLKKVLPLSVDSFNGKALMQYLTEGRGVDPIIAAKYLKEVHYRNNETGKVYFAVGIKNENEGYEIRNPHFKSSIGKKGVTFIKGKVEGKAAVYEGFTDFLSALTYYQSADFAIFQELVQGDTIIMNSASFHERTKELLKVGNYTKISLFLDNDKTGHKVRDQLQEQAPLFTVDCSSTYKDHKDFNEFLLTQINNRADKATHR